VVPLLSGDNSVFFGWTMAGLAFLAVAVRPHRKAELAYQGGHDQV